MALGVLERDFQSLQDRCIEVILSQLTQEEQIYSLKLPVRKKHFISEGLEDFQENVALAVNNHNINLSHCVCLQVLEAGHGWVYPHFCMILSTQ